MPKVECHTEGSPAAGAIMEIPETDGKVTFEQYINALLIRNVDNPDFMLTYQVKKR